MDQGNKLELNPQVLNQYYSTVSFSEVLYAGNKTRLAIASMKYLENASRLDAQKDRGDIVFNAISAYYNLYKIQQTKTAIEESITQVKEHLRNIKSYEKNGLALKNDVLKIELQLSSLTQSLLDINTALDIANYNMSLMLGFAEGTSYQLASESFFRSSLDKSYEDYLNTGLRNRLELRSADNRVKAAESGVKSAKNNLYPTLSAGTNYYNNRPNARVFPVAPEFTGTWDARLTLSWNFSSIWTNKARVHESNSLLQQTQASKEILTDGIKMEVNADYLSYLKSKEKIKVSETAVKQAEENYRIVNTQFKNNTALISDLTDANTLLLQSRVNLLVDKADADIRLL
jgi:outer membrane protein TolC